MTSPPELIQRREGARERGAGLGGAADGGNDR